MPSDDRALPSMEFGNLLYEMGQYKLAKDWHKLAFKYRREQYGYENTLTFDDMNRLAMTLDVDE